MSSNKSRTFLCELKLRGNNLANYLALGFCHEAFQKVRDKIFNKKTILLAVAVKMLFLAVTLAFFLIGSAGNADAAYGINPTIKQVKTADNAAVYYLDHKRGLKKSYINEKSFLAYSNKWSDVRIIKRSELNKWPETHLVKAWRDPKVYYINNGYKAWIRSKEEFAKLGFRWSDVVPVASADLANYKTVAFDQMMTAMGKSAAGGVDIAANETLAVSLDSASPAQKFIPTASRGNTIVVFKFKASDDEVKINKLILTRRGVTSDNNIEAVYLESESGEMYGYKAGVANKQAYINFGSEPIIIPAGQTKIILVKADIKPVADVVGQTFGLGITSAVDIDANTSVLANFPIWGAEHKLINGVDNLGKPQISSIILKNSIKTVTIGAQEEKITSFRFKEISGNEDILIKKIILTNIGSAFDTDLKNIRLIDNYGHLIMKAPAPVSKKIIFDLPNGYTIKKGRFVDLAIKLDIVGGDGRDVKFVINKTDDVTVKGLGNKYDLFVYTDESFPIGQACGSDCNRIAIKRAPVSLAAAALDKNKDKIYRDQNDAVIGLLEVRNGQSEIRIESIIVSVVTSQNAPVLDAPVYLMRLKNKDTEEISSIDGYQITNKESEVRMGRYGVPARANVKFAFLTHIPETAASGDTYQVVIKNINYYSAADNQLYTDATNVKGQNMKVVKPTLYLYAGKLVEKDLAVAAADKIKIGTFKIENSSDEKVKITGITIANAAGFKPATYTNGFANLVLYKGTAKMSDVIAIPHANSHAFNKLKLTVNAGEAIELNVKADANAEAAGEVKIVLENIEAEGYYSQAPVIINNKGAESPVVILTQTKLDAEALSGGSVSKEKDNKIASFKFINQAKEKIGLKEVVVSTNGCNGGLSATNGFSNMKFGYEESGKIRKIGYSVSKPVAESNKVSLSDHKIDIGQSVVMNLYIDAASSTSPCSMELKLYGIEAKGYISGVKATVTGDPTDNVTVVVDKISNSAGAQVQIANSNQTPTAGLVWPTSSRKVSYYFHDANHPYRNISEHEGIDIEASQGSSVMAAADGRVEEVVNNSNSDFNYVIINHGNNIRTFYGHLSEIGVKKGDEVKKGQAIGLSGGAPGTSGAGRYSNGPHLHFEVWQNGIPVDPMGYLK